MTQPSVRIELDRDAYEPGETLRGRYRLTDEDVALMASAVDVSVLWRTEGKGTEDQGMQSRQRWSAADGDLSDHLPEGTFALVLPASPLSYDGVLVKIRWVVRVRVLREGGGPIEQEADFTLGRVPPAQEVPK